MRPLLRSCPLLVLLAAAGCATSARISAPKSTSTSAAASTVVIPVSGMT